MSPRNRSIGIKALKVEHLEKVRSADPRGAEEEKYNNATVGLERFPR